MDFKKNNYEHAAPGHLAALNTLTSFLFSKTKKKKISYSIIYVEIHHRPAMLSTAFSKSPFNFSFFIFLLVWKY